MQLYSLLFDQHLYLGQVLHWVAGKDHAGALEVYFARRDDPCGADFFDVVGDFLIGFADCGVGSLVYQGDGLAAGEGAGTPGLRIQKTAPML